MTEQEWVFGGSMMRVNARPSRLSAICRAGTEGESPMFLRVKRKSFGEKGFWVWDDRLAFRFLLFYGPKRNERPGCPDLRAVVASFRAMLMSSALARSVCSFRKGMAPFFREVNSFPFGLIDGNAPTKRSI